MLTSTQMKKMERKKIVKQMLTKQSDFEIDADKYE